MGEFQTQTSPATALCRYRGHIFCTLFGHMDIYETVPELEVPCSWSEAIFTSQALKLPSKYGSTIWPRHKARMIRSQIDIKQPWRSYPSISCQKKPRIRGVRLWRSSSATRWDGRHLGRDHYISRGGGRDFFDKNFPARNEAKKPNPNWSQSRYKMKSMKASTAIVLPE